ncbi:MAG: hypothetical protein JST43_05510 [Bacteroidetes bacterium]|nr:hypothetical protein [Bacteroidota bacterium]MBS1539248.1 hypothetical protein [Bacteroidota bacterium]
MKNVMFKGLSVAVVAGILVLASCSKSDDNPLSATDVQNVSTESVASSQANEATDLGNTVMNNVSDAQLAQARSEWTIDLSNKDGRLKGATITITGTRGPNGISGTITINFGTGTVGGDGVTRSGQIIISYQGKRFVAGSTRQITFSNFVRNTVGISGGITVTVVSVDTATTAGTWVITHSHVSQLTFTFADNTTATRNANYTAVWTWVVASPNQNTVAHKAGGSATGTTRKGASYAMNITTNIMYTAACASTGYYFPQSGSKTLAVTPAGSSTANTYTFTFGNGGSTSCTNTVTIAFNGKTKTITISPSGN